MNYRNYLMFYQTRDSLFLLFNITLLTDSTFLLFYFKFPFTNLILFLPFLLVSKVTS